jgi:hypothetical protein
LTSITKLPTSLEELEIDGCGQLTDLTGVAGLEQLRVVHLENCRRLATLAPLLACPRLGLVSLWGSTSIADGRLRYLTELPSLAGIEIESERGVDMTLRDVDAFNASRGPAPKLSLMGV